MLRMDTGMIRNMLMCLLAVGVLAGCDGSDAYTPDPGVVLKGRVLHNGEPMHVERPDIGLGFVELVLFPEGTDPELDVDRAEATIAEPDGTFIFEGPGEGIPAGDYRLAVYHYEQGPEADKLEGAFSPANTPITIKVSSDDIGGDQDLGDLELTELLGQSSTAAE